MGQTLYAIIAMMIVSLFAMQQQRSTLRAQLDMIDNEIAVMSTGVAVERLEEISAFAFDQNTRGGETADSPSDLTPRGQFGEGYDQTGDDLDDFEGAVKTIYRSFSDNPEAQGQEDQVAFDVSTTVDYVREDDHDQVSSTPTKFKRVSVTVMVQADPGSGLDRLYDAEGIAQRSVTLSQLFSCGSACQWGNGSEEEE